MAPPIKPIADRIRSKVSINDRGCWIWQGPIFKDGYGCIGIKRTGPQRAHRVSYATFVAPIPPGLWVLHRCDTPACVNPEHLFVGTAKDNAQDRAKKGRSKNLYGQSHSLAKHTDRFVWGVRKLDRFGIPIQQIADIFGESYSAMHQLCRGGGWKKLDSKAINSAVVQQWGKR